MSKGESEKKEMDRNTELIKKEHDSKSEYIFQNSPITRKGLAIILSFVLVLLVGLWLSGVIFTDTQ